MKKYFMLVGKVCLSVILFLGIVIFCLIFLKLNRKNIFQEFTTDYTQRNDFSKNRETECIEQIENEHYVPDVLNKIQETDDNSLLYDFSDENKLSIQKDKNVFSEKSISQEENTQRNEKEKKSSELKSISENTNIDFPNLQKDSEQSDLGFYFAETDVGQKKLYNVNAGVGIVPVFFARGTFLLDYFNQQCFLSPCGTLKIIFSQINQYVFALSFDAVITYLDLFSRNYLKNINLGLSSFFYLVQINISISRFIFNQKNLLEIHFGTGIAYLENINIKINDLISSNIKSLNLALNFGFSLNHFFTEKIFSSFLVNFTYCIPSENKIILVQPGLIFGIKI